MAADDGSTLYNSGEFATSLGDLAKAFALYGEEISSAESIGNDFFSDESGAIYSPKVGNKLKDTWNDHIADDFGDFVSAFDTWMDTVTKEGELLEDFQREKMNLYQNISSEYTGAEFSASDAISELAQETPIDLSTITNNNGENRSLYGLTEQEVDAISQSSEGLITKFYRLIARGQSPKNLTADQFLLFGALQKIAESDNRRRSQHGKRFAQYYNDSVETEIHEAGHIVVPSMAPTEERVSTE